MAVGLAQASSGRETRPIQTLTQPSSAFRTRRRPTPRWATSGSASPSGAPIAWRLMKAVESLTEAATHSTNSSAALSDRAGRGCWRRPGRPPNARCAGP